jgi:hypothetical protein
MPNCFESNGDLWGCLWDGHSGGDDYNLYEGNVTSQFYQDQTHGGKLASSVFRNLFTGWESCSNGQCSPSATMKNANVDAVAILSYNRYDNLVGNVLGTPGISTLGYIYTQPDWFEDDTPGSGHIYNLASGNQNAPPDVAGGPIPIDPVVLSTTMMWNNWDAFNNGVMTCTAQATPFATCPQDERADTAPMYPGLTNPGTSLPASFYLTSRPSWWFSSIPFPAIGPDVTGGNVGQCGGTPNAAGQYAFVAADSASQCAGKGLNAAWGGHVNAIPAMNCYLNVMNGTPDGSGGPLTFDANSCYGSGVSQGSAPHHIFFYG